MSDPRPRPVVLVVLDGWGVSDRSVGNAIEAARAPFYKKILSEAPHSLLAASGLAVGLPEGQMGNSEVGHLNMGAGRVVYQEFTRISESIEDGSFFRNEALLAAVDLCRKGSGRLHLLGLVSDGGVHSHLNHLIALLRLAAEKRVPHVFIHAFLDGRDTPPQSAVGYIRSVEEAAAVIGTGRIVTVAGRYWAMDRDRRWDRTARAYHALVLGEGDPADSPIDAIERAYRNGITDEFVPPSVVIREGQPVALLNNGDAAIFFNFRADRARQLTAALTRSDFSGFPRKKIVRFSTFVTMTPYDETWSLPVAFKPVRMNNILGEVISRLGLKQLRIAETEKYAHVTYFFNGGVERVYPGEERILIQSPKDVPTYDKRPQMSAEPLTDEAIRQIGTEKFDLVVLNFANPDMVGHTGVIKAAVAAVETIDCCIQRFAEAVLSAGGVLLLTADHGNIEEMIDEKSGEPHTAHTTNPVPLILIGDSRFSPNRVRLKSGIFANVAPTILDLMGIPKPAEMDQESLLIRLG